MHAKSALFSMQEQGKKKSPVVKQITKLLNIFKRTKKMDRTMKSL